MPILDFRKPALSYGFADPKEDERAARVLAAAPVLLAGALVAIYIDPIEPRATPFSRAYTFLFAYVLYSVRALIVLTVLGNPCRFRAAMCASDLIWASLLTTFTQGPNSSSKFEGGVNVEPSAQRSEDDVDEFVAVRRSTRRL